MFKKATKSQIKIRLSLSGAAGSGKAQPFDAKILTPLGWKLMGNIQVGDSIINSQGLSSRVTGVYPQGLKDVYRVIFTDGSSTECCADHLWLTQSHLDRNRHRQGTVKPLHAIMESLKSERGKKLHYIPMVKPVEFSEPLLLPVNPYLLGVLLGDGCLRDQAVLFSNPETEIQQRVQELLPVGCSLKPISANGKDFAIRRDSQRVEHKVLNALRLLGLDGKKSNEKFIPPQYKFSSSATRLAVLQGLLDTDGYTSGTTLEYSTSSRTLAEDVLFLIESLGGRAHVSLKEPKYTYNGETRIGLPSYRMFIRLPGEIQPFRLQRKADKYIPKTKYQPARAIDKIEYVGVKPVQCIAVDAPDNLYVTDRCILTHNTYSALAIASHLSKKIAVIDTERGSASRYADIFGFDVCELSNHHPSNYIKAIQAAEASDYEVIVIDSLSHAWFAELDLVDRAKNSFTAWKDVRPLERKLIDTITSSPAHIIATMRSKTEWDTSQTDPKTGKMKPVKIGTAPIQTSGIEYEFDIAGELSQDHILYISKSRCPQLADRSFLKPGKDLAHALRVWMGEVWLTWKSEEDAIAWAAIQLPDLPLETIRSEFENLPLANGKKAVAWVERVKQLVDPF